MGSTVVSWTNALTLANCSNVHVLINTVGDCFDCWYHLCVWMMWCNGIPVWILYRNGIPNGRSRRTFWWLGMRAARSRLGRRGKQLDRILVPSSCNEKLTSRPSRPSYKMRAPTSASLKQKQRNPWTMSVIYLTNGYGYSNSTTLKKTTKHSLKDPSMNWITSRIHTVTFTLQLKCTKNLGSPAQLLVTMGAISTA